MSDLYDDDILLWSERQGELLRRRAAGELVNDAELDWPNIAEEIESVGSEQLHAVESLLVQALAHMLPKRLQVVRIDLGDEVKGFILCSDTGV